MTDKEYQHALDLMEKGIRADEREKVLEKLKGLLQIEYQKDNIDWSEMCVLDKVIRKLKEQK